MTYPDWNKQSVITEWYMSNRPGDKHIEKIWLRRYSEIHESVAMATLEE
jgi:hypothetical protein